MQWRRVPWWRPIALAVMAVTAIFFLPQKSGSGAAPVAEREASERERLEDIELELQALQREVQRLRGRSCRESATLPFCAIGTTLCAWHADAGKNQDEWGAAVIEVRGRFRQPAFF